MFSMKAETDDYYGKINRFEETKKNYDEISDKFDADIRDFGKKVQKLEVAMDECLENLVSTNAKEAEKIIKEAGHFESRTMNNEVEIETLDKDLREARRIEEDSEMKYDNLARTLSMIKDELKRAEERVKNADARLVIISEELQAIGENQKQLEVSEEKARRREESTRTRSSSSTSGSPSPST